MHCMSTFNNKHGNNFIPFPTPQNTLAHSREMYIQTSVHSIEERDCPWMTWVDSVDALILKTLGDITATLAGDGYKCH